MGGGTGLVQRVKMQPRRAVAQQLFALLRRVFDAKFRASLIVVNKLFQPAQQRRGQRRAAQRGEALDLVGVQDGNDAGAERHRHAPLRQVVAEAEEIGVAEEKLSQYEIRAAIDLGLQPVPIHFPPLHAGDVALRESGGADAKAAHLLDERDQLISKREASLRFFELALAAGRIAAQGENIFYAQRPGLEQDSAEFPGGRSDARQVEQGGQMVLALDAIHGHERLIARASARAVSHRTIIRLQFLESGEGLLQEIAIPFLRLGRKEFERDDRLPQRRLSRINITNELHGYD